LPAFAFAGETPALPDSRPAFRPSPLWSAGSLPAFVFAGGTPALPNLRAGRPRSQIRGRRFGRVLRGARASCPLLPLRAGRPRSQICGRRLGRFLSGARASCPLLFLRAGRPRSVFCPSEKARQRASRRGIAPRIPGMNAGPKTACGGKRPSTGVVAQPRARELPNVLVPLDDPQNLTRHECRAEDRLRRQTPVGGRLRTTSCRRSSRYFASGRE